MKETDQQKYGAWPMKGLLRAFVFSLVAAGPVCMVSAAQATSTETHTPQVNAGQLPAQPIASLAVLHTLDNAQASHALRVAFEGVVTYYRRGSRDLFVQDGPNSIYVDAPTDLNLAFGDRVLITGRTHDSFRPEILSDSVKFLRRDVVPEPIPATFQEMIRGELDTKRVKASGVVLSANLMRDAGGEKLRLQLQMNGGMIDADAPWDGLQTGWAKPEDLLDAEVELTGTVSGKFDYKVQLTGIQLEVPSLALVRILKPAAVAPLALPVTPMDSIIRMVDVKGHVGRVRIHGSVTYYQPGAALVLEEGPKSLWVATQYEQPLELGRYVDVTGFPGGHNGALALNRGVIAEVGGWAPVTPRLLSAADLYQGTYAFDLVSVEGRILMSVRDEGQDQYVLVSGGHLFSAVLRHPERGLESSLKPFRQVAVGSTVRVTGICAVENADITSGRVVFQILMRSADDIAVVRGPSLLSVKSLIGVVLFLLVVILAAAARQWRVERRMRQQTAELARVEQRKNVILEEINGAQPLPGILSKILELVEFRLRGARCWCDLVDGTKCGVEPEANGDADGHRWRRVSVPASGPDGAPLGILHAAFERGMQPDPAEESTLAMAAALVTLALETRRLYADLVHRSEFDMLTEISNRFSFERGLSETLSRHENGQGRFGLIYVDLDGFKQINDLYGHKVGDLYLQTVAARMKNRMRPGDLLARIGGDEFALLVSDVARREDVLEIAGRINECFDTPFTIGPYELDGAASLGIAFFPEDGGSKDELLIAADAAMYVEKNTKRQGIGTREQGTGL
jgi:diguanylate cyclase (GGDEF)-like protein